MGSSLMSMRRASINSAPQQGVAEVRESASGCILGAAACWRLKEERLNDTEVA
jgi:hypothetical protein